MKISSSKNGALELRPLRSSDHDACTRLIHQSLVHWYQSRLAQGSRFGASHEGFRIFPEVYEALDAGAAVAACDQESGELLGVCFVHPRPTHVAVGIVAVAPKAQSRGVARAMLVPILEAARVSGRPVRLVSSLLNLDSFSLYSRLGFVPHTIYQDMILAVSPAGLPHPPPENAAHVFQICDRNAASRLADFEYELQGIRREQDYAFFLANRVGDWQVWAGESADGELEGFLVASRHPACTMLGPGVARDETTAAALLWRALDAMRGLSPVFLVPSQAHALVQRCYAWGARNIELHVAQAAGAIFPARGIAFPTFLPESA
jgi:GNAT superfamily N-acetyltransferase